jgi:hypothetical protein
MEMHTANRRAALQHTEICIVVRVGKRGGVQCTAHVLHGRESITVTTLPLYLSACTAALYPSVCAAASLSVSQGVVAHANFEHRTSGPAAAKAVYDQALARDQQQQQGQEQQGEGGKRSGSNGKNGSSGGSSSSSSSSAAGFLYVVYANFLRQVGCLDGTLLRLTYLYCGALFHTSLIPGDIEHDRLVKSQTMPLWDCLPVLAQIGVQDKDWCAGQSCSHVDSYVSITLAAMLCRCCLMLLLHIQCCTPSFHMTLATPALSRASAAVLCTAFALSIHRHFLFVWPCHCVLCRCCVVLILHGQCCTPCLHSPSQCLFRWVTLVTVRPCYCVVQVLSDVVAARSVLHRGLQQYPACREVWEGALWFEETLPGGRLLFLGGGLSIVLIDHGFSCWVAAGLCDMTSYMSACLLESPCAACTSCLRCHDVECCALLQPLAVPY